MNWETIITGISPAHWCKGGNAEYEIASMPPGPGDQGNSHNLSWFDELFKGGIRVPSGEDDQPLLMLIEGAPGSGKSTLAMELCVRTCCLSEGKAGLLRELCSEPVKMSALYLTLDTSAKTCLAKFNSFSWCDDCGLVTEYVPNSGEAATGHCYVAGVDEISEPRDQSGAVRHLLDVLAGVFTSSPDSTERLRDIAQSWISCGAPAKIFGESNPDIVVVDSLNVLETQVERSAWLDAVLRSVVGCKLVICVMDVSSGTDPHWEFRADTVIRLCSNNTESNYLVRTVEIIKARYQEHVMGQHQLKVYPTPEQFSDLHGSTKVRLRRRGHPYLNKGGFFIYPSIHFFLSTYKRGRITKEHQAWVEAYPKKLNSLVRSQNDDSSCRHGLFPKGRCSALIGYRGSHKSHLAYCHCLNRLLKNEYTLIVSLRDDEEMTLNTMARIITQEKNLQKALGWPDDSPNTLEKARAFLDQRIREDRLEVLYFPPGYITPEEFYHRMMMSVYRMIDDNISSMEQDEKEDWRQNVKITLMFNSLDQLQARFPLCAAQPIFVPGMVESLSAEGITSLVIAVSDEKGQPEQQYGLRPMADLILAFRRDTIPNKEYCRLCDRDVVSCNKETKCEKNGCGLSLAGTPKDKQAVTMVVVDRAAGGQAAGAMGILDLVHDLQESPQESIGLNFVKSR